MKDDRQFSPVDRVIIGIADAMQTLCTPARADRPFPAATEDAELSEQDKQKSAGYMRVNHVGEVCAQALYQSQALTATDPSLREKMQSAADEEVDHLAWCEQRLDELGSRKSLLNPLWYAGSFAIGAVAGIAGDRWNLGFVAETERQVVQHLETHLAVLPDKDRRSREVVEQMKQDESAHARMATDAGAAELPAPIKSLMKIASGVMTRTAYWL
ncbi:MAG: 2-polyprenyl-3-methyl-6-methoxy-1,4-benzoquinone monooxygenase [bacterium]